MIKKIIFVSIILILVGLLIFGYALLVTKSKALIADFIKKNLTENATIGYIGLEYPFRIALQDVKIFTQQNGEKKAIVKMKKIYIYPHPAIFFKNNILISKVAILDPELIVVRDLKGSFNFPIRKGLVKGDGDGLKKLFISRIDLINGNLDYFDRRLGDKFRLSFENIDARLDNLVFPFGIGSSKFRLSSSLKDSKQNSASLALNGYIRMHDRGLKAKLSLRDMDVRILEPLYSRYLLGFIKQGILDFDSRLESRNQILKADCRLNIQHAVFVKDVKIGPQDNLFAEFSLCINPKDFSIKIEKVRGNFFEILFDKD